MSETLLYATIYAAVVIQRVEMKMSLETGISSVRSAPGRREPHTQEHEYNKEGDSRRKVSRKSKTL